MTDLELLKQYGEEQSQQAFAELVGRHLEWVYGAAVRRVHDRELAEDVAQGVFIALSRRAKSLGGEQALSPWLLRVVRCAAINALRGQRRRQRHEQKAAAMRPESIFNAGSEAQWEEVAPLLDDQVLRLGKKDQKAILLRFYERKSLADVGEAMGLSEKAAQKRVERAVGKLRGILEKKGVRGTMAGLSAVLVGNVVGQMPAGLAEKIVLAVGSGGGNSVAAGIAKGAMKMMTYAKVKVAAVMIATGLLAVGIIAAAVAAGTDGQTAGNPADAARGEPGKPQAADTAKQTGEGMDCMRRMSDVGRALAIYGEEHDGHLPPDLGSAFTYLAIWTKKDDTKSFISIPLTPREKAERCLSPKDAQDTQIPEQPTSAWVNQHTSFSYMGSPDVVFSRISNIDSAKTIILYEKRKTGYPDINHGWIPALFVDWHVEGCDPQKIDRMIAKSKKVLEAARVPATGPAK